MGELLLSAIGSRQGARQRLGAACLPGAATLPAAECWARHLPPMRLGVRGPGLLVTAEGRFVLSVHPALSAAVPGGELRQEVELSRCLVPLKEGGMSTCGYFSLWPPE